MKNIDQKDRNILRELQKDAVLSVDSLSEKVHLSRNACWRRIKRMEEEGLITARVALLDAEQLGLGLSVYVFIRTNVHEPGWLEEFRAAIRELPEIVGGHRMSGDLDYVLRVRVADVRAYDRFYQKLIKRVAIANVSASFVMEDIKDTTALPL